MRYWPGADSPRLRTSRLSSTNGADWVFPQQKKEEQKEEKRFLFSLRHLPETLLEPPHCGNRATSVRFAILRGTGDTKDTIKRHYERRMRNDGKKSNKRPDGYIGIHALVIFWTFLPENGCKIRGAVNKTRSVELANGLEEQHCITDSIPAKSI